MYCLNEIIGDYNQTITIDGPNGNTLKIKRGNEIIYNGVADYIVDSKDTIKWKTPEGKQMEIRKYNSFTYS